MPATLLLVDDHALFRTGLRLIVQDHPDVGAIAEAGSNIEHVAMDSDPERLFTLLHFTIQVSHRTHLAAVMRGLRHIPEVSRIARERGGEV